MRTTATLDIIKEAAMTLGQKLHPRKIILFGSYAYGKPNKTSDVDLLIIKKGKQKARQYALQASMILTPRPFPVDILVRDTGEIKKRLELGDFFIQEIVDKGLVLYEETNKSR